MSTNPLLDSSGSVPLGDLLALMQHIQQTNVCVCGDAAGHAGWPLCLQDHLQKKETTHG